MQLAPGRICCLIISPRWLCGWEGRGHLTGVATGLIMDVVIECRNLEVGDASVAARNRQDNNWAYSTSVYN